MFSNLKLAITNRCPLRCKYCCVEKGDQVMDIQTAKKALDFFLKKRVDEQQIFIYGGEPLLFPELLKQTIAYAISVAKKQRKKVSIWVGTNGVLLTRNLLEFFSKHKVGLAVSLGGDKQSHDKYRSYENGEGSFDMTLSNLKLMLKDFPRQQYSIGFCMHPSQANKFYDNFLYLCSLGFERFHSELIYDDRRPWTDAEMKIAQKEHARIWDYISENIKKNKAIYYAKYLDFSDTTINKKIRKRKGKCIFKNIEIMPTGDMFLSPYLAYSLKNSVGSLTKGLKKNLFDCELNFDKIDHQICVRCKSSHLKQIKHIMENVGVLEEMFNKISKKYLRRIDCLGKRGKKYLTHLKQNPYT